MSDQQRYDANDQTDVYEADAYETDAYEYGYGYADGTGDGRVVKGSPTDGGIQGDGGRQKKGLSNKAKGVITLALVGAYLLWPADAIPDVAVGLGQLDDAIVFATGVISILMRLRGSKK